ncbi:DUF4241 domain-containing protein [Kribbella sp. NPDC058245]|uniref:DUF4241 domain-containing protein n=1 Tax=Kribbella sp. NPDC058245 TaxID=3346399 RepID=UPI0036E85C9D
MTVFAGGVLDGEGAVRPAVDNGPVVAASVSPGSYSVVLSVATWQHSPNPAIASPMRRICAAKVQILPDAVDIWRPARMSKNDDHPVPLGVPVDSGTASFFDFSARQWLGGLQRNDNHWAHALDCMRRDLYARFEDPNLTASVVMFECGMGDGVYDLSLGLTKDGRIAEIVLDLELLSHSLGPL